MSRAGVNVILEGKLYQRGQFLTWPFKQKWKLLDQYGITFVVNLWSKVDPDLSSSKLGQTYLNWVCSPSDVPDNATLLVNIIAGMIDVGAVVLVHCEAGRGRSVWLSARVLAEIEGITRSEALRRT